MKTPSFWKWLTRSRGRLFLIVIISLLVLDTARSVYARTAYRNEAEPFQEVPYQGMVWPPGSDLPADTPDGERTYVERCAVCHGLDGKGNGPAAPSMIPRPTDFTIGQYKYKTTPAGIAPSDEDLFQTVRDGLPASAMPYWGDLLSNQEIVEVVDYIKSFSTTFETGSASASLIVPEIKTGEASVQRGSELFISSGCIACHGADGRLQNRLMDSRGYPAQARDLTAPWTFHGGSDIEAIYTRITAGLAPSPMPAYQETLSEQERVDIATFVTSLYRTSPWEPGGSLEGPGTTDDPAKRGEYLVHAEMCGLCHTQVNDDLIYSGETYYLAGGMGIPAGPQGTFVSRNLTGDPKTGLGKWSVEEVADAIRNGKARDRYLNLWGMPWMVLHSFEEEDAMAIATYLKSLAPVTNKIPPPLKFGFLETMIRKAASSSGVPPLGDPEKLVYRAGNFGQTDPGLFKRGWLQSWLVGGQYIALLLGFVGFYAAAPVEKRWPSGFWGWLKRVLAWIGIFLLAFLAWVVYSTPVLPFVPPAIVNQAVTSGIHEPAPADFGSPEEAALAARGQYLFTVTSCSFCHGIDGSGGAKINSPAFGTLWARNISSDPETGIGNWSDAEILRAIRSGVSQDGTALHWQGMIWDHLSNLDEEDMQAIVVYLRTLPPVSNEVPTSAPPSADDCQDYSFFIISSSTPGCDP